MFRRFLISIAILLGLAVAADAVLRNAAEGQMASRLQGAIALGNEPEVELGGWPFVVNLLRGRFPSLSVTGNDLESGGLTLSEVRLDLIRVRFSIAGLSSGRGALRAARGRGTATLLESDLNRALQRKNLDVTAVMDGKVLLLRSQELGTEVEVRPTLGGRSLSLGTIPAIGPISFELPDVLGGLAYRTVEVADGGLRLGFALKRVSLDLGERTR